MPHTSLHVAFCGLSGFPVSTAASVNKMTAMARGLAEAGCEVSIINRKGVIDPKRGLEDRPEGEHQGLRYYTAGGTLLRPKGFAKRNFLKVFGMFQEVALLMRLKRQRGLDVVVLDTPYLGVIMLYWLLRFLLGYKLVYQYVEMRSEIRKPGKGRLEQWRHEQIDHRVIKWFDGVLPISSVLQEWVEKRKPDMPILRVPVLADYHQFALDKRPEREPYYLYCGSSAYFEVIFFILEAFEALPSTNQVKLYLIIRGPQDKQEKVLARIAASPRHADIEVFSNLPYEELAHKYVDALGLLIPLRPTKQDAARFPYKVSEYLATGNPVVTTNYGELRDYFRDGENGLVAEVYELAQYVEKLQYIVDHPAEAAAIGQAGYEMGIEHFHYARIGKRFCQYLAQLTGRSVVTQTQQQVSVS
jgi:glycosyltransferase involved in cell wall biosynthesis